MATPTCCRRIAVGLIALALAAPVAVAGDAHIPKGAEAVLWGYVTQVDQAKRTLDVVCTYTFVTSNGRIVKRVSGKASLVHVALTNRTLITRQAAGQAKPPKLSFASVKLGQELCVGTPRAVQAGRCTALSLDLTSDAPSVGTTYSALLELGSAAETKRFLGRCSDRSQAWDMVDAALVTGTPADLIGLLDWLCASPKFATARGETLLWAAERGKRAHVQALLARGVSVNWQNGDGNTALHRAASGGNSNMVVLLLSKGARADTRNKAGKTPLDMAANQPVRDLLTKAAAEQASAPEAQPQPSQPALSEAEAVVQAKAAKDAGEYDKALSLLANVTGADGLWVKAWVLVAKEQRGEAASAFEAFLAAAKPDDARRAQAQATIQRLRGDGEG